MDERPQILDYRTPATVAARRSWPLHVACVLTAILAFPLVWMGGLVTSHGAGMSVPDWPNSYGYNMFALPFSLWLGKYAGGTFYEHTHRLLGTVVGLSAFTATMIAWSPSHTLRWRRVWGGASLVAFIGFVATLTVAETLRASGRIDVKVYQVWTHVFSGLGGVAVAAFIAWRSRAGRDRVRWRRWAVTGILIAIAIQGAFGGKRVTDVSLLLAEVHGIFGQLVFAFAAAVAVTTSAWWQRPTPAPSPDGIALRRLATAALCLILVQLMLGATMRHDPLRTAATGGGGAGLAIPDWPTQYGHVLPPTDRVGLAAANGVRVYELNLPPTTLEAVWLHFAHRLGAYATATLCLTLAFHAWRNHRSNAAIVRPALVLGALVSAQVTLGVLTVLHRKPADIATAHQATGALLLMTCSVLLVRIVRVYPFAVRRAVDDGARSPQPAAIALSGVR